MKPPLKYLIRLALSEDRAALEKLIALSARALSRDDYTNKEIETAIAYIYGVDSELIADGTYFIVENESYYLACGGWSKRRTLFGGDQYAGRASGFLDPKTEPAKIRAFFVHPDYARQGVASALLGHCEEQAKEHGFSSIEMMATLPGVKLYEKRGYQSDPAVNHATPDGADIRFIPMRKRLY